MITTTTPPEARHARHALLRLVASITVAGIAGAAYKAIDHGQLQHYLPPLSIVLFAFAIMFALLCWAAKLPSYALADDRTWQALILLGKGAAIFALLLLPPYALSFGGIRGLILCVLGYGAGLCLLDRVYAHDRHFAQLPMVARDAYLLLLSLSIVCQWIRAMA